MEHYCKYDKNIVNIIKQFKPFNSQWSPSFLKKCSNLIAKIKTKTKTKTKKYDINSQHTEKYVPSLDSIKIVRDIFLNYETNKAIIDGSLKPEQVQLLVKLFETNVIKNRKDFYYLIGHLPFYHEVTKLIEKLMPLNSLLNIFISPIIDDWIVNNCDLKTSIDLTIDNQIHAHIDIIHNQSQSKTINSIIEIVTSTLCGIITLYGIKNPKKLNLVYIPTPFPKKINYFKNNSRLNRILISELKKIKSINYNYTNFTNSISNLNVNSGVTVTYSQPSYNSQTSSKDSITIWRSEEFQKVLVHELIHYYDLEKGTEFTLNESIHFNISNTYPHYSKEMFTELQTWLVYSLINMSCCEQSLTTDDISYILNYERFYALFNICKFFRHYQITDFQQFFVDNKKNNQHMINASSSILYYYILKGVVLFNINPFIEKLLLPENKSHISKKIHVTQNMIEHIEQCLQSNDLNTFINKLLTNMIDNDNNSLNMMGLHNFKNSV